MKAPKSTLGRRLYWKWRHLFRVYQHYGLVLNIWLAVKNFFLIFLKSDVYNEIKWLDCYIPGRIIAGSRVPEASKYVAGIVAVGLIIHRLIIKHMGARFNLCCLEFCYQNHKRLEGMLSDSLKSRQLPSFTSQTIEVSGDALYEASSDQRFINPLDRLPNHIGHQTRLFADRLFSLLHLLAIVSFVFPYSLIFALNSWMFGPVIFTRRGFELFRKECVQWIHRQPQSSPIHDYIYPANRSKQLSEIFTDQPIPLVLPYIEVVPPNAYHVVRIVWDIAENLAHWFGIGVFIFYHLYVGLRFSIESSIYAHTLKVRLSALIDNQLRQVVVIYAELGDDGGDNDVGLRLGCRRKLSHSSWREMNRHNSHSHLLLREQITQLQMAIMDHFNLLAFYNNFHSLSLRLITSLWLLYTFIMSIRVFQVDKITAVSQLDHGVQVEFFGFFMVCVVALSPLLICASITESLARQLYKTITVAMALDQNVESTKLRWVTLMRYFTPKKLYCFTILGNTGISWLFCLKLFSWAISALVILKSL